MTTSNTISRRAATEVPAGVLPVRIGDDSPGAVLARFEHAIELLRSRHVAGDFSVDEVACARALAYFRRAAAGRSPEGDADEKLVIEFLGRHGLSTDWIFLGNPAPMICAGAALSAQAGALA
jgi:hypothetical protein